MRFFKAPLLSLLGALLVAFAAPAAAQGTDVTRRYADAFRDACAFGAAHVQALREHTVLLVPGYLADLYPENFVDHLRWLAALGVDHRKVAIAAGDSVEINAAIIANAIRAARKPVLLITHSKGSVDALQALIGNPALRARVHGWISLQGVFYGSPVADKLLDDRVLSPLISALILSVIGGTRESAKGMTTHASAAYLKRHATQIAQVLRDVPALAFASVAARSAPGAAPTTNLEVPLELMAADGIRSDGLVPLDAAVLPGMDFVKVSGVDHIAPVMPARLPLDRVRMTQSLLIAMRGPWRNLQRDARCAPRR